MLALVGAFGAGRFSAPLKVETRDVEKVVFRDKVVIQERVVTVEKETKAKARIVWRDRVVSKDGTVTEREIEKTNTSDTAERTTNTARDTAAESTGERTREVTRTVTLRPSWRVAVLAGASWNAPLVPIAGPLVLGAEVDYRIVGGLSAGLWANTGGSAGLAVSFEF